MDPDHKISPEDVRAQYSALSAFHNTVVTFRFSVLGLYLAAVSIIISGAPSTKNSILILFISAATFFLELRNRSLYKNLIECGMKTEKVYFGYEGSKANDPFFNHMMHVWTDPWIFNSHPIKLKVFTHTNAINFLYAVIILYAIFAPILYVWLK